MSNGRDWISSGRDSMSNGREFISSGRDWMSNGRDWISSGREWSEVGARLLARSLESAPRTALERARRMARCAGTRLPSESFTVASAKSERPTKSLTSLAPVTSLWCVPMDGLSSPLCARAFSTASRSGAASKCDAASSSAVSSACAAGVTSSSGWRVSSSAIPAYQYSRSCSSALYDSSRPSSSTRANSRGCPSAGDAGLEGVLRSTTGTFAPFSALPVLVRSACHHSDAAQSMTRWAGTMRPSRPSRPPRTSSMSASSTSISGAFPAGGITGARACGGGALFDQKLRLTSPPKHFFRVWEGAADADSTAWEKSGVSPSPRSALVSKYPAARQQVRHRLAVSAWHSCGSWAGAWAAVGGVSVNPYSMVTCGAHSTRRRLRFRHGDLGRGGGGA
eukprot:104022-Prymnesium_polylepis.1